MYTTNDEFYNYYFHIIDFVRLYLEMQKTTFINNITADCLTIDYWSVEQRT